MAIDMRVLREKYAALAACLDEARLRLWAAAEARSLGHGGIESVAQVTGLSRRTIHRGLEELELHLGRTGNRLSLALEAGLGFEVALRRSAERYPGRLGEELRRMVRQLDRGHARGAALEEMAGRNPSEDLRAFAAAVRQADRLGTSLARALRVQSGLLRDRRRRRAQEAGRRLPVLIVFPLVFFFLPALLIVYLAPPLLHLFLGR